MNDWGKYEKLVIFRLDEMKEELCRVHLELHKVKVELTSIKAKASLWGLVAGTLPATVAIVWQILA